MTVIVTHKKCYSCGIIKPVNEFYRSNIHYFQKECKICNKQRKFKWHQTEIGKLSSTNTKLKCRFGITLEQYNEMFKNQMGLCASCGEPETIIMNGVLKKLCVDHCHVTVRVRSLLCSGCNVALGNLKKNTSKILKLAQYNEMIKDIANI